MIPTHYTPEHNPFGDRRAWADLCRARLFPARKVGRRWLARCEDFDRWFAGQPQPVGSLEEAAELEGIRLVG